MSVVEWMIHMVFTTEGFFEVTIESWYEYIENWHEYTWIYFLVIIIMCLALDTWKLKIGTNYKVHLQNRHS